MIRQLTRRTEAILRSKRLHLFLCMLPLPGLLFSCSTSSHRVLDAKPNSGREKATQSNMRICLWNGKDIDGWLVYLNDTNVEPTSTWSVSNGGLRLDTVARGYLRTKTSYSNYHAHIEWRWPENAPNNSNSGVLLHLHGPDAVWPLCFEAQLKNGNAGQVVGMGLDIPDAPIVNNRKRSPRLAKASEKPVGQWNTYEIYCRDDTIEVFVNGVRQNWVDKLPVSKGAIGLQMEGYPIEFRNLWLERQ